MYFVPMWGDARPKLGTGLKKLPNCLSLLLAKTTSPLLKQPFNMACLGSYLSRRRPTQPTFVFAICLAAHNLLLWSNISHIFPGTRSARIAVWTGLHVLACSSVPIFPELRTSRRYMLRFRTALQSFLDLIEIFHCHLNAQNRHRRRTAESTEMVHCCELPTRRHWSVELGATTQHATWLPIRG